MSRTVITATLTAILLALAAGWCLPTQAGINARLGQATGSAILAATISFAVGTLALTLYAGLLRIPLPATGTLAELPWWVWSGGILGAFFVATTIILAPKLGATAMVALIIAGQMSASVLLDHYGWLGFQLHPVNPWRLLGIGLIVAGVVLVRRF